MAAASSLALVGATGLIGSALLPTFLNALSTGRLSSVRILTASPSSSKLSTARATPHAEVREVKYADAASLEEALQGVDVLVSTMEAQGEVQSPMFESKKHHLAEAKARGLQVLAVHNGLELEMSFSDWLGIPIRCATLLQTRSPFTLSAVLQTRNFPSFPWPLPSQLRLYSDSLTFDEVASLWEKYAGGKIERVYKTTEELRAKYEEIKPTLKSGMLGPAIPLMIAGDFAFKPSTVEDFLREKAEELKKQRETEQ
ncbi:hypothetical protein JCM8547_000189 [Rhodosporidiobolus lusitaniae]